MNLGGFDVFIVRIFAIAAFVTLISIFASAAYGAKLGATRKHNWLAMLCGCFSGVVVAVIAVCLLQSGPSFVLFLVVGPILGVAASYIVARVVARPLP